METVLLVISVLLIAIVLLQSGKAEGASQIITGGNSDLFKNRKERGSELIISRATLVLGISFFVICLVMTLIQETSILKFFYYIGINYKSTANWT